MKNDPTLHNAIEGIPRIGLGRLVEEPSANRGKYRILVVDDEVSATRMLKLNLEQTNAFVVRTENDPGHALASAIEFQPDLILLDVLMPGMDGGELSSRFQSHPRLKSVPIVFLTAAATKNEVRRGSGRIGGLPFIAKPVDLRELLASLDQHLVHIAGYNAASHPQPQSGQHRSARH